MVRLDNKIREVVNAIKLEEAKLANLTNTFRAELYLS